jgi:hypothetical protein
MPILPLSSHAASALPAGRVHCRVLSVALGRMRRRSLLPGRKKKDVSSMKPLGNYS